MKKISKPNISPLEVEIENKISNAYLFAVAAKTAHSKIKKEMNDQYPVITSESLFQSIISNKNHNK